MFSPLHLFDPCRLSIFFTYFRESEISFNESLSLKKTTFLAFLEVKRVRYNININIKSNQMTNKNIFKVQNYLFVFLNVIKIRETFRNFSLNLHKFRLWRHPRFPFYIIISTSLWMYQYQCCIYQFAFW